MKDRMGAVVILALLYPRLDEMAAQRAFGNPQLNRDTIIRYWNGDILYTDEALAALKPLPGGD